MANDNIRRLLCQHLFGTACSCTLTVLETSELTLVHGPRAVQPRRQILLHPHLLPLTDQSGVAKDKVEVTQMNHADCAADIPGLGGQAS